MICKVESTFLNLLILYFPKLHGYEELSFSTNSTVKYTLDIQDELGWMDLPLQFLPFLEYGWILGSWSRKHTTCQIDLTRFLRNFSETTTLNESIHCQGWMSSGDS